jgi:hypothetical protein
MLSRLFDLHDAVVIVRPSTIVRWHELGWRISGDENAGRVDLMPGSIRAAQTPVGLRCKYVCVDMDQRVCRGGI